MKTDLTPQQVGDIVVNYRLHVISTYDEVVKLSNLGISQPWIDITDKDGKSLGYKARLEVR